MNLTLCARRSVVFLLIAAVLLGVLPATAMAAPPVFSSVGPDRPLALPADFGAHPDFRTEWWYATGWLTAPDGTPLGFQVTFFRSATGHDAANPSRFAPKQLIIAHAALSDPALGRLQHGQKAARQGFGIAYAKVGNTDVKLDDWRLQRKLDGSYQALINTGDFQLALALTPTQAPMLQGDGGVSRKGPHPAQASYYYSEPQLAVTGSILRQGKTTVVTGTAWLDHEWSTSYLDPNATGWDWLGANLADGSALMAFQIRNRHGGVLWAHAALRDPSGKITHFASEQVQFTRLRTWRSPRTEAAYPVAMQIRAGKLTWQLIPLQDDQELDSTASTGAVYWEGAVSVMRDGRRIGGGYLELTGYVKPLKL